MEATVGSVGKAPVYGAVGQSPNIDDVLEEKS